LILARCWATRLENPPFPSGSGGVSGSLRNPLLWSLDPETYAAAFGETTISIPINFRA
jgi:hypothetical protein